MYTWHTRGRLWPGGYGNSTTVFHGIASLRHSENAHTNNPCPIEFLWAFSPSPWTRFAAGYCSLRNYNPIPVHLKPPRSNLLSQDKNPRYQTMCLPRPHAIKRNRSLFHTPLCWILRVRVGVRVHCFHFFRKLSPSQHPLSSPTPATQLNYKSPDYLLFTAYCAPPSPPYHPSLPRPQWKPIAKEERIAALTTFH